MEQRAHLYIDCVNVCAWQARKIKSKRAAAVSQYSFRATVHSRAKGRSATASAAYRAGEKILDERTGLTFDYRKKPVESARIFAPEHAGAWAENRAELWNAVELAEKRKDAQVCREILLALPCELTAEQREALVHDWVKRELVSRGMIADVCIHAPDPGGDERNFHAHILVTTRNLTPDGEGFAGKNRDWNGKDLLQNWRESWAEHVNAAYKKNGIDNRWDHRSYADQGLDRVATQHLGPQASAMERDGIDTDLGTANAYARAYNANRELAEVIVLAETAEAQAAQALRDAQAELGELAEARIELAEVVDLAPIRQAKVEQESAKMTTVADYSKRYKQLQQERERLQEGIEKMEAQTQPSLDKIGDRLEQHRKALEQHQRHLEAFQPGQNSGLLGQFGRMIYKLVTGKTYLSAEERRDYQQRLEKLEQAKAREAKESANIAELKAQVAAAIQPARDSLKKTIEAQETLVQQGSEAGLLASPEQLEALAERIETELPPGDGALYAVQRDEAIERAGRLKSAAQGVRQGLGVVPATKLETDSEWADQRIAEAQATSAQNLADLQTIREAAQWSARNLPPYRAQQALLAADRLEASHSRGLELMAENDNRRAALERMGAIHVPHDPKVARMIERLETDGTRQTLQAAQVQAAQELETTLAAAAADPDNAVLATQAQEAGELAGELDVPVTDAQAQQLEKLDEEWGTLEDFRLQQQEMQQQQQQQQQQMANGPTMG